MGVLNRRDYDQLDALVDADACTQNMERRQVAQPAGSLPRPNKL